MTVPTGSAQLTYTSYDAVQGGRGGWQVKERTAALTAADEQQALRLVATTLELTAPPGAFPSAEDLARLPARLLVQVDPHGTAFVVHTSLAGADASGRPGNVFNHVLVLPALVDGVLAGQPRPLEWWRSPGWLTPYGADAVGAATLGRAALLPGPVVSRASVARFLRQQADSPVLGALLDAVAGALAGGPRVVLAADQEEAVHWLAAVSFLAPPQQQADLSLSTYERAHTLQSGAPGALLSVLPRSDLTGLTSLGGCLLIDAHAQHRANGSWWRCALGSAPVGAWSALGQPLATATDTGLIDRLVLLDELSGDHPRATATDPRWPLAVAVAEASGGGTARAVAQRVLVGVPLAALDRRDVHTTGTVLLALEDVAGTTAQSTWAALRGLPSQNLREGNVGWFYERYVALLASDPRRLQGSWPPETLDRGTEEDPARQGRLAATIDRQLAALPDLVTDPVVLSVVNLRLLDLAGLLGVTAALAGTPTVQAVVGQVSMLLAGRSAGAIVAACGPVLLQTAGLLLPGAVGAGRQLDAAVLGWLSDVLLGSELGDPEAVALAGALLDAGLPDRPCALSVRHLAQVHRCCAPGWWRTGQDGWADSATLLLSGLALLGDSPCLPARLTDQLRPQLVTAAVRTLIWSPTDPRTAVAADLLGRLGATAELHPVTHGLAGALEPLGAMLLRHERLGRELCLHAARLDLDGVPPEQRPLLFSLLAEEDREALGLSSLGAVALSLALHHQPSPRDWLEDVLLGLGPAGEGQIALRAAWITQTMHRAAPLDLRPDPPTDRR